MPLTAKDYRKMALALPEALESSHMGHPDFRVRGKIFATIRSPKNGEGVVKLTAAQQKVYTEEAPAVFAPVVGGWGREGWTTVHLSHATGTIVRRALQTAWHNVAPKRLAAQFRAKSF